MNVLSIRNLSKSFGQQQIIKNLNMYVLSRFYYTPFDEKEEFYPQFYQRLETAKELLKLEI